MDTMMNPGVDEYDDRADSHPPPNGSEDTDAFDAFNDDTFGAGADAWDEEDHEQLAKLTEEEMHGFSAANDFFELDDATGGDDDCLEPAGSTTINGDEEDLAEQMASLRTSELSSIPPPPKPEFSMRPSPNEQLRPQFPPQPDFVDPAIMSMGQMPLPPRPYYPPPQQSTNVAAQAPKPMTVEELEREMMAKQQQEQQLRMLQQIQQQQQQQQQLQQQQMFLQQQIMQRAQMQHKHEQEQLMRQQQLQHLQQQQQQQQQQHQRYHHNQQRQHNQQHLHGFQSRQQQQYQQFQNQPPPPPPQQQRHQQNDSFDHQGRGRRNFNRGNHRERDQLQKAYDDKDRETFGDDFVTDHQQQQRQDQNQLIMPGHVHVQSILRGSSTSNNNNNRGGHQQPLMASTGNPTLDLQRENESRRPQHHYSDQEDEYAGLMASRERQWIINIQLNQLKDENDYYYTVHRQKKKAAEEGIDLKKGRQFFFGEEEDEEDSEDENDENRGVLTNRILRRDDETQLLLKSESASDSPRDQYRPQQYENSLGKLQAVTVKAPRKIIDVMGVLNQDAEQLSAAQKDSRNFKKTLLELERLYNTLIDVEDCEKKLVALPTGTSLRSQVEADGKEGIQKFGQQLVREDKLKLYIAVRKGKALLIRALRWLNTSQMKILCTTLFLNYPLAVKKDREDKLLKDFWHSGIRRHLANCSSLGLLHYYMKLILSDQGQSKSGSILKHTVTTPLGMSFLLTIIHKLNLIHQQQPNGDKSTSRNLLMTMAIKLQEECKNEKFSPPVTPMGLDIPTKILDSKDLQSESFTLLQRLAQAGLHEMSPNNV